MRRHWLSEQDYAGIVSLCQFLPGPASSQVGLIVGMLRAGHRGALAAWLGFTLPSAIALTVFAMSLTKFSDSVLSGLIHGLKIVAVAIVAQAVWGMAKSLCADLPRRLIMLASAVLVLCYPFVAGQLAAIFLSGMIGLIVLSNNTETSPSQQSVYIGRRLGIFYLLLFFTLLLSLPLIAQWSSGQSAELFSSFYRAGSLVFGGGHVVLPLLQTEIVNPGYINNQTFIAGYGAAQAVPGPLFTFAAFLGASVDGASLGWYGSLLCLLAIFLPSFLLVAGVLPFWEIVRNSSRAQSALAGINAGVVGLLLAVLYMPLGTSTIHSFGDAVWALLAFAVLVVFKCPSWLIVVVCAAIGLALKFMTL